MPVNELLVILLLIAASAFFSMSEISLAASRKIKLRLMAEGGHINAQRVLALQDSPGNFFTVVQIGLNAVAILGGVMGEQALSPYVTELLRTAYDGPMLDTGAFIVSFVFVTSLFVLFADLMPKRLAMLQPERIAVAVVQPMQVCMWLFAPLVWVFNGAANLIFRWFKLPSARIEDITADDIMAMADAGAQAGALLRQEQHLISNVFELDSRIVPSAMTSRESIVFLTLSESEESIRRKIAAHPHGKFPVCEDGIDSRPMRQFNPKELQQIANALQRYPLFPYLQAARLNRQLALTRPVAVQPGAESTLPLDDEIAAARAVSGWGRLRLNREARAVQQLPQHHDPEVDGRP